MAISLSLYIYTTIYIINRKRQFVLLTFLPLSVCLVLKCINYSKPFFKRKYIIIKLGLRSLFHFFIFPFFRLFRFFSFISIIILLWENA
ncbi:hypothetical protein [Plasmodium yoelii yoelii]|uniref:Uncharacterized protein n=1 Tax=Plasmodium yoelii yoelii TaxID=73239 RepID=Q7RFN6_PLAYO|nr:hypothetical protein [Plasmodium yoelii yoelii]